MAADIPEADKVSFISTIPAQLPCADCAYHFRRIMKEFPPTEPAEEWLIMAHNKVNRRLGKRPVTMRRAKRLARRATPPRDNLVLGVVLGAILVAVMVNGWQGRLR